MHGHIGEIGVFNGTTSAFFGKILQIFEPHSLSLVHGFDWFKGNFPSKKEDSDKSLKGGSKGSYNDLIEILKSQGLDKRVIIHNQNITKIDNFFKINKNKGIYFKLVYMDCGFYDVSRPAIESVWKRLVPGGIMIFDQLYHSLAPGESKAKHELLNSFKAYKLDFSWMPTAFVIKDFEK